MLPSSWSRQLRQALSRLDARNHVGAISGQLPRVAFVGIGNEFNADDCVGPLIARKLAAKLKPRENVLILDAGTAPENFSGTLRKFQPDLVVLIDAVDMEQPVGTIAWLPWDAVEGMDAFTHGLPPSVLGAYLRQELGCEVGILGIQPASLTFDQPPAREVIASVTRMMGRIIKILNYQNY
ncbi:MAG TPA: hypothetical protein DCZ08_04755 [Anaerolineaceae bacterium]|nr:hypothetical protein [Anaerolineaceae bacterium]